MLMNRLPTHEFEASSSRFAEYFPAFRVEDFQGLERWSGLRPLSPDGLPYLGRSARWSNLVVSSGHAMMGVSLALISGKIASEIIEGERPSVEGLAMLSPDRY